MTARIGTVCIVAALLVTFGAADGAGATDLARRSEMEVVATWSRLAESAARSCADLNAAGDCVGPAYADTGTLSRTVVRARGWLTEHVGAELQLGATVANWSLRSYGSDGTTHDDRRTVVLPLWRALVLTDWRWFAAGVGVSVEQLWTGNDMSPKFAGSVRVGPQFLHLEGHYKDGAWMVTNEFDQVAVGIGGGFDVPRSASVGSWNLWSDLDLRLEGWAGMTNPIGFDGDGGSEAGVRVVTRHASVRIARMWFADDPGYVAYMAHTYRYRYTHDDAWVLGVALPLGGP